MSSVTPINRRTDPKTERLVITKIAQGIKYQEIYEEIGVPVSTIKKIKKRNLHLFYEVRQEIIKKDAAVAARLHHKAHILLERRIDAALTGKADMSTKDLVSVVKEMTAQVEREKEEAATNQQEQATLASMLELAKAIEDDDIKTIEKIAFQKNETQTLT